MSRWGRVKALEREVKELRENQVLNLVFIRSLFEHVMDKPIEQIEFDVVLEPLADKTIATIKAMAKKELDDE